MTFPPLKLQKAALKSGLLFYSDYVMPAKAGLQEAFPQNPPDPRHPGESRDPSPTACVKRTFNRLARMAKGRRWIPAFAGMTPEE
jgi:hypothetical protein